MILIFFLLILGTYSQSADILGSWKCTKEESVFPEEKVPTLLGGDNSNDCNHHFRLDPDGIEWDYSLEASFTYQLTDTLLLLGNRYFVVERMSSDSLIMREYDDGMKLSISRFHFLKEE